MNIPRTLSAIAAGLSLLLVLACQSEQPHPHLLAITRGRSPLYASPDTRSEVKLYVAQSTVLVVEAHKNGWLQVIGPDGQHAWLQESLAEIAEPTKEGGAEKNKHDNYSRDRATGMYIGEDRTTEIADRVEKIEKRLDALEGRK